MPHISENTILIDVMLGNHHECQLEYPLESCQLLDCGNRIVPVLEQDALCSFIESKYPSLKNKNYRVEFTNYKI